MSGVLWKYWNTPVVKACSRNIVPGPVIDPAHDKAVNRIWFLKKPQFFSQFDLRKSLKDNRDWSRVRHPDTVFSNIRIRIRLIWTRVCNCEGSWAVSSSWAPSSPSAPPSSLSPSPRTSRAGSCASLSVGRISWAKNLYRYIWIYERFLLGTKMCEFRQPLVRKN